jgi:hypothetical protein
MKRFNLLLVNNEAMVGHMVLKTLGKVFRSNFVFEVANLDEAEKILAKLNIHLLLIDLDHHSIDLTDYSRRLPNCYVMGYHSKQSTAASALEPFRNKIIRREGLQEELLSDFRLMRKEWAEQLPVGQRIFRAPHLLDLFRTVPG